jgi:hypothetical protein
MTKNGTLIAAGDAYRDRRTDVAGGRRSDERQGDWPQLIPADQSRSCGPPEPPDGSETVGVGSTGPIGARTDTSGQKSGSARVARQHFVLCHVDARPCALAGGLPATQIENFLAVRDRWPCDDCWERERHAHRLTKGGRIGRRERSILHLAASPGAEPVVIPCEGSSAADREGHRRAIRELAAAGLVKVRRKKIDVTTKTIAVTDSGYRTLPGRRVERRYCVTAVVRTALGQAVVDLIGDLRSRAKVIRWNRFRAALIARAHASPSKVRREFVRRLRHYIEACNYFEVVGPLKLSAAVKRDAAAALVQIFDDGDRT